MKARVAFAGAVVAAALGCSSAPAEDPSACAGTSIDQLKELVVVDEGVLADPRTKNASTGHFSFRYLVENLAPAGMDPSPFLLEWLTEWASVKELNGFPADRVNELRGGQVNERVLCPWLKQTATNACDATCGTCAERKLDLAKAPFRLVSIVNRLDERDANPMSPQGEGRLLFGLTSGPADDPASTPLPMTIIFEYHHHEGKTVKEWAEAWHALGAHASFDEGYRAELQALTDSFTARGARPGGRSALAQLRTNESAFNWIWQLREFGLTADGRLKQKAVRNTPGEALNGSQQLADWVVENAATVRTGKFQIPLGFQAPTSDALLYRWRLPGVDEATRVAFSTATCSGCHTIDKPRIDTAFHISPFRSGVDKLSPFLRDPNGRADELGRRADAMKTLLCAP